MKNNIFYKIQLLVFFIMGIFNTYSQTTSQDFELLVPNKNFMAEAGTGVDTKIKVQFKEGFSNAVCLSSSAPEGISAIFQPDTIWKTDTVVLSVFVNKSGLAGEQLSVILKATDSFTSFQETITITVLPGDTYLDNYLATQYRDTALKYLITKYPEIIDNYGDLSHFSWQGFFSYPPLDIVSHYVNLYENWRINVQWHVMVPPYNWKKIFIYNNEIDEGWGIEMDTDDKFKEIPCEKWYYFNQDTNAFTGIIPFNEDYRATIYPNPFRDEITIKFPENLKQALYFNLYNTNGSVIYRNIQARDGVFNLKGNHLKSGLYFYRIIGNGFVNSGKITKY